MARERTFNFVPVTNEDLRKKKDPNSEDFIPYVRVMDNGQMVIPKKTLEVLGMSTDRGAIVYLKFFIDVDKRAIGFKIMDLFNLEDIKEKVKKCRVSAQNSTVSARIGITALLRMLGDVELNIKYELTKYSDDDPYLSVGEVWTFIMHKAKKSNNQSTDDKVLVKRCSYCHSIIENVTMEQHFQICISRLNRIKTNETSTITAGS